MARTAYEAAAAGWTDEDLCDRLDSGDDDALAELYDRRGPQAFRVAIRIVGSREAAEDIVQAAFIKLWRGPGSYRRERGSFGTWFMRLVRNLAIDQLRRNGSLNRLGAVLCQEITVQGQIDDPYDEVIRRSSYADVYDALRSLPVAQRQVVELAYFFNRTVPQIASLTALPITTVKGRMRLALQRMRREIGSAQGPVGQPAG